MQAWNFENKVFELEGVRIIVRTRTDFDIGDFDYRRCARSNMTLSDWLETRVYPLTGDLEVTVVNGRGEFPHGNTHMGTLRDSYPVE